MAMGVPDNYFATQSGTVIVREGSGPLPWLVTWLPNDENDPAYPGFTITSSVGEVPPGPTVESVANWAARQPWATRTPANSEPAPPAEAETLDVPPDEWHDLQETAFEHGVRLAFTKEPDGSFSWGVYSLDGDLLQYGIAETWDDARLAMIENVYPPSGEG
jgi:hypothetical protein